MQKENVFFFSFPSASNFGGARVTNKRAKCKRKTCYSFHFRVPEASMEPEFPFKGARGAPSYHVLATDKHGLSFFTTWSDESDRARYEKKTPKEISFLANKTSFSWHFFVLVFGGKSTEGAIDDRQGCYPGLSSAIVYQPSEGDRTCYLFSISYILVSVAPSGLSLLSHHYPGTNTPVCVLSSLRDFDKHKD